jgi:hypothetical protein
VNVADSKGNAAVSGTVYAWWEDGFSRWFDGGIYGEKSLTRLLDMTRRLDVKFACHAGTVTRRILCGAGSRRRNGFM